MVSLELVDLGHIAALLRLFLAEKLIEDDGNETKDADIGCADDVASEIARWNFRFVTFGLIDAIDDRFRE